MDLRINAKLKIPENEMKWRFSRSSGVGGQNINKIESRVEVIFDVFKSKALTPFQKHQISIQSQVKLINGSICITAQNQRTQYQNRKVALSRLASTLRELLKAPPKQRKATIPTRTSQKKRIESKKKRGEIKRTRQSMVDY